MVFDLESALVFVFYTPVSFHLIYTPFLAFILVVTPFLFHTHSLFFTSILSSLSISIGPYQEEPNRKSKFRGEEWRGA